MSSFPNLTAIFFTKKNTYSKKEFDDASGSDNIVKKIQATCEDSSYNCDERIIAEKDVFDGLKDHPQTVLVFDPKKVKPSYSDNTLELEMDQFGDTEELDLVDLTTNVYSRSGVTQSTTLALAPPHYTLRSSEPSAKQIVGTSKSDPNGIREGDHFPLRRLIYYTSEAKIDNRTGQMAHWVLERRDRRGWKEAILAFIAALMGAATAVVFEEAFAKDKPTKSRMPVGDGHPTN